MPRIFIITLTMTLSPEEENLIGAMAPDSRGLRLEPLYEHYRQIVKERRKRLELRTFDMRYPLMGVRYKRMEIISKNLKNYDKVLVSRVGEHGEERYAVMAYALAAERMLDYADKKGVGVYMSVADNPYGLDTFYRYNKEYHERNARRRKKFHGTNDGVRFQLPNGRWVDVIEGGREGAKKVKRWVLADERDVLPIEAKLPLKRLRQLLKTGDLNFQKQRIAFYNPHEDHIATEDFKEQPTDGLPGDGFYFCGYGEPSDYKGMVKKAEKLVPVLRNRQVDTGDGGDGRSNNVGQVYKFDGSLGNAYYLLGAVDAVTMDFREEVRTPEMKEIVGIFMLGLIDKLVY